VSTIADEYRSHAGSRRCVISHHLSPLGQNFGLSQRSPGMSLMVPSSGTQPLCITRAADDRQFSDRRDGRELHPLIPFFGLIDDEFSKIRWRVRKRSAAKIDKLRLHLRVGKGGIDFRVEPVDDFGRGVLWGADAAPAAYRETGQKIAHGRQVR